MAPWADLQLRAAADPPKVFAQARAERRRIVMRRFKLSTKCRQLETGVLQNTRITRKGGAHPS